MLKITSNLQIKTVVLASLGFIPTAPIKTIIIL